VASQAALAAASVAAGEPNTITNTPVTAAAGYCSRSPRSSHNPWTVGRQLAKFTNVGSVRGCSSID